MGRLITRLSVVVSFILHACNGFAEGPPFSTCLTMFPKHGEDLTWKKSGPCPFEIKLSSNTYRPLQNITITIEANDGRQLRGVQISAHRKSVNVEEFHGTFLSYSPEDKLQVFSCFGGRHNQVGHKNNHTVDKLVLEWQAPGENIGDIVFKATFVHNFSTFWVLERKELYTYDQGSVIQPLSVVETPSHEMDDIDFSGCGSDRGCFFYPRYCSGSDCDAALTYRRNGEMYSFEMMAKSPGYVTVGLSKDKTMGDDYTITCTAFKNMTTVQHGINPEYYNFRVITRNLTKLRVKQTPSHVMCTFIRPRVLGVEWWIPGSDPPKISTMSFDLEDSWHIMMSWGHVPYGTDVMGKHTELPIVSDSMVSFQSVDVHSGSVLSREMQAHGSLMVVAWVLFTGLAVVIARYYKDLGQSKLMCGVKVWFQLHRGVAFSCLLFTAISFIIIFVKVQKLSEKAGYAHAVVGITVGVAVLLQVFVGLIRPGPDSNARPWFRWGHRLLGQGTHLLAAVNIFLAFNMKYTPNSMSMFGSIAVLVWIGIQVIWELVLDLWSCRKNLTQGKGVISSSKGMNIQEGDTQPSTRPDLILLVLYCLTLVIFTVTILCAVIMF